MTPIEQTALTLACMIGSHFVGRRNGAKSSIQYIFSFMTDPEIEKIVMKIEDDQRFR